MTVRKTSTPRLLATVSAAAAWLACVSAASPIAGSNLEARVATIGYRLASAGVGRCPRRAPLTGLRLHDLTAYDQHLRQGISKRFGLTDGMGVLDLVSGAPAQRAGLVAGDEIVALNDVPVATLVLPQTGKLASYDRVEAFTDVLSAALARGGAWVTVRRNGTNGRVFIPLQEGCAIQFVVLPGSTPAAWSDGRYAAVSQGLAREAGDSELAFALAHEMAHVVLGHAEAKRPPLAGLGFGGAKTRNREREADERGMLIALDAGYNVDGAEALLQRLTSAKAGISLTHPSLVARMAAIRRVANGRGDNPKR
jgi:hypothetical protein